VTSGRMTAVGVLLAPDCEDLTRMGVNRWGVIGVCLNAYGCRWRELPVAGLEIRLEMLARGGRLAMSHQVLQEVHRYHRQLR